MGRSEAASGYWTSGPQGEGNVPLPLYSQIKEGLFPKRTRVSMPSDTDSQKAPSYGVAFVDRGPGRRE